MKKITITMKKFLLSFFAFLMLSATIDAQNLVISEIMYNNPGAGNDSLEFVEIYNAGSAAVNLKNFTFRTAFNDTLPDVSLAVGGYYTVAFNTAFFKKVFGFSPNNQWKQGALNNTGERIDLYNATGALIDSVRYASAAPWPTAANGNGPSLVFCDFTKDNGNVANWTTSTNSAGKLNNIDLFASPGKEDCKGTVAVKANKVTIIMQKNLSSVALTSALVSPASATVEFTTTPVNGKIAPTAGGNPGFVYTPNTNFCGLETLNFKACLGTNCDATGQVTFNVFCPTSYPKYSIGVVTADKDNNFSPDSLSRFVEVEGVVHSPNYNTSPSIQYCIIDEANKNDGITVFRNGRDFGYTPKEGDKIRVQGRISTLSGTTTISPDTIFTNGKGTVFTPTTVTKLDEVTENALVEIKGLTLTTPAQWTSAGTGFNLDAKDAAGNTFVVRVDKDIADLFTSKGPGTNKFDCIGIGTQFASAAPFNTGYQILPRKLSDLKIFVGVNDATLGKAITIFPNPFVNEIKVNSTENLDKIVISDASGRVIDFFIQPDNNQLILTQNWANGIYFITAEKDGRQFTTKVVK
jgi:Lamin Tail Domain/Secretion system C-terminal sorting domain